MANHTIDCPHCGADQRGGYPCCDGARRDEEEARAARAATRSERMALFDRFGIAWYVTGDHDRQQVLPEAESVVRFLRSTRFAQKFDQRPVDALVPG